MRKTIYLFIFLIIFSLMGCNSAPVNNEPAYKIINIPVKIINAPPNVEIELTNNSVEASLDKQSNQLALSFDGIVKNNTKGTIRFIKYSLRSYANDKRLFERGDRFLTGHEKLDSGMSENISDLILIEQYKDPLPDKIIIEITDFADY